MNKKTQKRIALLAIGSLLAMGGVAFLPERAFSYLSSFQEADIDIKATPADKIWKMDGDFQVDRWKDTFSTGIQVTNLTGGDDLWIYFEYTGDLKNVFQHQDPVLLLAGSTVELQLNPLDNQDSPRVLNPSDIVNAEGQWRDFRGTVRVHTLNKYATLETKNITIPGNILWDVLFAQKFKEGPAPEEVETEDRAPEDAAQAQATQAEEVKRAASEPADVEQGAVEAVKEARDYSKEVRDFKPLELMQQVTRIVDKVAPGLLEEHGFLFQVKERLLSMVDRLTRDIERLIEDRHRLQDKIESQENQIHQLLNELDWAYERNAALENEVHNLRATVHSLQNPPAPAAPGNNPDQGNPPAPAGAGETSSGEDPASQGDSGNSGNDAGNQGAESTGGNTGSSVAEGSSGNE